MSDKKAYMREYRRTHREQIKKKILEWRYLHPASVKQWRHTSYLRHRDRELARTHLCNWVAIREKFKREVLSHYSNGLLACVRCGINDIRVLTLDHVAGNGSTHRKQLKTKGGHRVYAWCRRNNYPPGFQVLCMNCQWIKRHENSEWKNQFEQPVHEDMLSQTNVPSFT